MPGYTTLASLAFLCRGDASTLWSSPGISTGPAPAGPHSYVGDPKAEHSAAGEISQEQKKGGKSPYLIC